MLFGLQVLIEIIVVLLLLTGYYFEEDIIEFEQKMFATWKEKYHEFYRKN